MDIIFLFIVGLAVGILSSFFGVGGGIIIVPTLFVLFEALSPKEIISISLLTIFFNTAYNNFNFYKKGDSPNKKTILIFIIFCFFGALLGNSLINFLNPKAIRILFALILILIVIRNVTKNEILTHNSNQRKEPPIIMATTAIFGSFLSAITGLGGGVIYIPLFQNVAKIPIKKISAYSNFAMMVGVFFALIPHVLEKNLHLSYASILIIGSLFTGKLGIKFNEIVQAKTKKNLLALILLISALNILYKTLR
ncbi:MAG: sulfite exporter TauE/SafE family protein [Bacteriovoracaceae bacterium]|jgi:uncharacterized membrane protein YfcA|nr:sulfite exporter TauE/SafE family protein [Bacteriovoracaceae bacterium]